MNAPLISTYMETSSGRSLGIDFGDVKVLVQPQSKDAQKRAGDLAGSIADNESVLASLRAQVKVADLEIERLKERLRNATASLAEKDAAIAASITGKRRFFSAVMLKPKTPGDWTGEVWLLDPVKQEKGRAIRFESIRELRGVHPELWIVSADANGVLLDGWCES